MSLSREFFTSSPSAQDEVIRVLARKAIEHARAKNAGARDVFDRFTRGLLHVKHATGAPREELAAMRRHFRYLFSQENTKAVPPSAVVSEPVLA
jgi:hypothetical protein